MLVECRYTASNFEVRSDGPRTTIEGHAAVFNRESEDLGGFVEQVNPGAFSKTLAEADVRALFNHNPMYVLGRNRSGTLRMSEDSSGLYYEVDLPDTTFARDLMTSMERGDINQSSFKFIKIQDDWSHNERSMPLRSLQEVKLLDVSPVTYPAYLDAESGVGARALEAFAEERGLDPSVVKADLSAAIRGEIRSEIAENEEPGSTHSPQYDLSLAKAKLRIAELRRSR